MLMKPIQAAVLVLLISLSGGVSAKQTRERSARVSCRDALHIVAVVASSESSGEDVFLATPPRVPKDVVATSYGGPELAPFTERSAFWQTGWLGMRPSRALVRRWLAMPYQSIGVCFGGERSRTVQNLEKRRPSPVTVSQRSSDEVQATFPVVDTSAKEALLVYSTSATPGVTGGKTEFILLGLRNGVWRIKGRGPLSVS